MNDITKKEKGADKLTEDETILIRALRDPEMRKGINSILECSKPKEPLMDGHDLIMIDEASVSLEECRDLLSLLLDGIDDDRPQKDSESYSTEAACFCRGRIQLYISGLSILFEKVNDTQKTLAAIAER